MENSFKNQSSSHQGGNLETQFLSKYKNHIKNLVSVTRSDVRNEQNMSSGETNFDMGFKKILKNLDEKILEINKMKKEIQAYKQALEE